MSVICARQKLPGSTTSTCKHPLFHPVSLTGKLGVLRGTGSLRCLLALPTPLGWGARKELQVTARWFSNRSLCHRHLAGPSF